MTHFSQGGQPIATYLRVKVFALENKKCTLRVFRPKSGHGWSASVVDEILDGISADLERRLPGYEYKRVRIGPLSFNFVFVGTREVPAERIDDGASQVGIQGGEQGSS